MHRSKAPEHQRAPRDQYEALHAARSRETSQEYRAEYNRRAGIEGTISQGVRTCGLRRSRYMAQTQHPCHQPQSRRLCGQHVARVEGQTGVHVEVEDAVGVDVAVDQRCQGAEVFGREAP